ncbi:MAG: hypothetical protein U0798_12975 [Gemmataceae bacterium]
MFVVLFVSLAQAPDTITPLTVSPAHAPVPSLRFELLPRTSEKSRGNAAVGYYQALLNRPAWPKEATAIQKQLEAEEKFKSVPIEELSTRDLTEYLKPYQATFRLADWAALNDRCDWQRDHQLSGEGLFTMLPDIQQQRELARIFDLRIRLAAADNKFDEATLALKTGMQHAKHVGESPTMIQLLVGLALANVQLKRVEDVIQRPGSPNLYWALTSLPHPFIDPKPGLEGEEAFLNSTISGIKAIETATVTADQATYAIEQFSKAFFESSDDRALKTLSTRMGIVGYAAIYHEQAKKELIERGRTAKELDAMPPTQVVLLRAIAVYREMMQDRIRLFSVPYPAASKLLESGKAKLTAIREGSDPLARVFSLGVPAFDKVFEAHARTERRIALLRAVEAVRMHAAKNGGKPPARLEDITLVPVPDDPNTGKPFEYRMTEQSVRIVAIPPAGGQPDAINSMGYTITFRK